MWPGFDPDVRRQLRIVRDMAVRQHQTPTKEWPLVFVEEHDALLVVREWPGGAITAYAMPRRSDQGGGHPDKAGA